MFTGQAGRVLVFKWRRCLCHLCHVPIYRQYFVSKLYPCKSFFVWQRLFFCKWHNMAKVVHKLCPCVVSNCLHNCNIKWYQTLTSLIILAISDNILFDQSTKCILQVLTIFYSIFTWLIWFQSRMIHAPNYGVIMHHARLFASLSNLNVIQQGNNYQYTNVPAVPLTRCYFMVTVSLCSTVQLYFKNFK